MAYPPADMDDVTGRWRWWPDLSQRAISHRLAIGAGCYRTETKLCRWTRPAASVGTENNLRNSMQIRWH
ncbi:MAG TPA: hypothetical protein EYO71_02790 [Rhodospirillales bacterium]|nr:hypothetical protein [Rhodospirillales bacterium]